MFENFYYHKVFWVTPRCPKHQGVILKCLEPSQEAKNISNGTRRSCLGKITDYKISHETVPLRDTRLID